MATPSVLKRIGDKASDYKSMLKSIPPGESEFQGVRAVQQNVDQATQPMQKEQEQPAAGVELLNPMARYGDRSGEKRLDVDIDGNIVSHQGLKPMAPVENVEPAPVQSKPGLKPIPSSLSQTMPVYDQGGDVKVPEDHKMTVKAGPLKDEDYMPRYGESAAVANRPAVEKPVPQGLKPLPLYDDGGDVDVNDGKHQVAVLEDGEKVLTPEQAEQYRKEHGAPAGFGGRVLPNEKGIKPILDTEAQPRVDEPTKDGKMSTDNAPLTLPTGDISNPPASDMGGAQPRESSTQKLRPFSEVSKEKQQAQEKANNPGAPTIDSGTEENEVKPRGGTPSEQKAIDTDIKNAMGQGVNGLTKLGLAKIQEKLLPPAGFNGGEQAPPAEAPSAPAQPGLKPIAGAAPAPELDHKARIEDYNKRIQAALDKATPEGQEEAERLAVAKQEYIHSTPWGSANNHPGFLGKLGHVAEKVGARLPVIGQVMGAIPGTEASRNVEHNTTLGQLQKDTPLTTAREAEQNVADKNSKDSKEWAPLPRPVLNPDSGHYEEALYNKSDPTQIKFKGQADGEKPVSGQENKDAFQKVLAKIGTPEVADPSTQMAAITAAHEAKKITDDEYNTSIGYLGANPAPATQMASSTAKTDAANKAKRAGKWFTWADDEGIHYGTGDKVPENSEPVEVDGKTFMNEARSGNIVQKSLNTIGKDVYEHPELFDNAAARSILATTLEQIDRTSAGLLIAGTGGNIPLPSGMGDMINTALQNKTLDEKTSRALKNYIADYKSMKDKVIVMQMEMQGGKIGRGSAQAFKAIADQIPNGATADSQTAKRQMTNLFTTQADLMGKYPDRYQNYTKEKPYAAGEPTEAAPEQSNKEHQKFVQSINLPGGGHPADAAKGPKGETIIWSGKAGDPWIDLVTGKPVK